MSLTHLHLLLNHFPVIGTIIALFLLMVAVAAKSDDLKRASLAIFLGIALLTIPTYLTGNAAEEGICKADIAAPCPEPGVSKALIDAHESAALVAFGFMELTGAFAWLGLWQFRRTSRLSRGTLATVLLLSLVTFGLMARVSNLGGEIRHPEIRSDLTAPATRSAEKPLARHIGELVQGGLGWIWPTCETLHFIGLCLLFGVTAVVDLRMLGLMKGVPFSGLHRLLPWGILGFGVNLITGMLFFVAAPIGNGGYVSNPTFAWKMLLILLAGVNVLYFTIFDQPWEVQAGDDAPLTAKVFAGAALCLVVGIIFCGRMLPFLGNSF
ncbi:MAG: hypothetical protein LAP40_16765 [Acidobacteriia bacterium]|nr:hypothetical protein [Terriglobia bacterium]